MRFHGNILIWLILLKKPNREGHKTAEGVETEEQRKMLIELGCTPMQGFCSAPRGRRPRSGRCCAAGGSERLGDVGSMGQGGSELAEQLADVVSAKCRSSLYDLSVTDQASY